MARLRRLSISFNGATKDSDSLMMAPSVVEKRDVLDGTILAWDAGARKAEAF